MDVTPRHLHLGVCLPLVHTWTHCMYRATNLNIKFDDLPCLDREGIPLEVCVCVCVCVCENEERRVNSRFTYLTVYDRKR